jgi:hypothetical protein
MRFSRPFRLIASICFLLIIIMVPVTGTSCSRQPTSGVVANTLAATQVPDTDLDIYIYFNQGSPTVVPKDLWHIPQDYSVESFSVWGVIDNDVYSIAGALTFTNTADANSIYSKLSASKDFWTKLSEKTIYLVQGAGIPADKLKSAISNNNFKRFSDTKALAELSRMPYSDSARPAAVAIIKPSKAAIELVKSHLGQDKASTLDSAYNLGKPDMIVCGLYSSEKLDIADIAEKFFNNSIWEINLGVMALMRSSLPGLVFSPAASHVLESNGYTRISAGSLTIYQTHASAPDGKSIPVLINVDGNQLFVTASAQQDFAEALLTEIRQ